MLRYITAFILSGLSYSTNTEPSVYVYDLQINVHNITICNGQLIIAVFNNKSDYLKNPLIHKQVDPIHCPSDRVRLQLPAGEYAVAVFHDTNGNLELDKNFLGVPKESFGFSNKSLGLFGAPSYKETKFLLDQDNKEITINLLHF